MISCLIQNKVNQDGPTKEEKFQSFTLVRKLDQMPLPFDIHLKIKEKRESNIKVINTEK